ncbi:MAG TPA: sigma-70 family RNA polymerase sigma factor [Urbifossiella sp.]|nr:sigma-70 family RNA polymerase sigma factor [Urbifossiella sp.]
MDAKPFTSVDRDLLKRCLNKEPGSWNDFVDRFLSLIYHVISYTAHLRSVRIGPEDKEDIAAEVLLKLIDNDFRVLREFRGHASLATYLTVIARRIAVREFIRRQKVKEAIRRGEVRNAEPEPDDAPAAIKGIERLEEVEKLLRRLSGREREIVRLYYFEGRTYEEISTATDVPVNTIGTVLSRARKKLRPASHSGADSLGIAATTAKPKKSRIQKPPPTPLPKRPPISGSANSTDKGPPA